MEEPPENGKESSHSAHANGMKEWIYYYFPICFGRFSNHHQGVAQECEQYKQMSN